MARLARAVSSCDLACWTVEFALEAAVTSAQAAYSAAVKTAGTNSSQLNASAEAVQQAQATLQQAQAAYDKVASAPNIGMLPQSVTLQQDTIAYQTALDNYQQIQVPVTTGLTNDTETQITSGLREGDTVVLSSTTTAAPRVGGGFGGPRVFPGGG